MKTVNETLIAARAIVEQGWNKYGMTDGHGNYCLKAAIGLACGVYEVVGNEVAMPRLNYSTCTTDELRNQADSLRTDLATMELVRQWLPAGFGCIPVFNDDPRTGKDDVLAVLDDAILFASANERQVMSA